MEVESGQVSAAAVWRRVSPVAMIYFLLLSIRSAVNLWPMLVPIVAGGDSFREFLLLRLVPVGGVLYLVGVVLHYWFFRYSVESDRIQLHTGIFHKKRLTLYFDRVQQADIIQPFYFRPFGLATLGLESAGSTQQEVNIPGLSFAEAEFLKQRVLEKQEQEDAAALPDRDESGKAEAAPDYQLHLSWREIARYGLMYNGLLILAPLLAPFTQNMGPSMETWFHWLEDTFVYHFFQRLGVGTGAGNEFWILSLVIAVALMIGVGLLFFLSVIIALVRYWDYRLTRYGDRYQSRAGLLTVNTRGFRLHKLQHVIISQGMIARLLGRTTLTIKKAGGGYQQQGVPDQKRFLIPVLDAGNLSAIKTQLNIPDSDWQRVSPFYILRNLLLFGTIFCAASIAGLLWLGADPGYALLSYPLAGLVNWRSWWCLGIYQDGDWLAMRSGFVGRRSHWIPIGKVQKTAVSLPPWLRPLGLANLSVWGADGRLDMPFIPVDQATHMRDHTLFCVATFDGNWF